MNQPPIIIIPNGGQGGGYGQPPGNRPPRRRKNRADKRADNEKKKKDDEKKKKKELTIRHIWTIGLFTLPISGMIVTFMFLGFGQGFVALTELALRAMKALINLK